MWARIIIPESWTVDTQGGSAVEHAHGAYKSVQSYQASGYIGAVLL